MELARKTDMKENRLPKPKATADLICLTIAVFLGAAQAWVSRHSVNSDAVSYLDIGDAYFRGDWNAALNAMWSPLYSWLLGAAVYLINPAPEWEFPLAHFVNFILYLAALSAFYFFLREVGIERRRRHQNFFADKGYLSDWVFKATAYLIFLWATLFLIKLKHIVPDLGVAAIVFLEAGLLLRLRKTESVHLFALFGAILGIGYLVKTPLLPIGALFFACLALTLKTKPGGVRRLAITALGFIIFAAPFAIALSISKNKLTFSENGKINYAWHVNGVKKFHWTGEEEGAGVPVHPTRKIFEKPAIYEFTAPFDATYPPWYDPTYWYEGVKVRFNLRQQARKLVGQTIYELLPAFSFYGFFLLTGFIVLLFLSENKLLFLEEIAAYWFLLIPSAAAILMYLLIHVETRYIAPFAAVILICFIGSVNAANFKKKKLALAVLYFAVILSVLPATLLTIKSNLSDLMLDRDTGDSISRAAMRAGDYGIMKGDKIASLGRANDNAAKWARLTKTKIVSEIYEQKDVEYFWQAAPDIKAKAIRAFRESGAKFIVTTDAPAFAADEGWQRLSETNFYVYPLQ